MFKPVDIRVLLQQQAEEAQKRANFRKEMRERLEREWNELQAAKRK